MYLNERSALIEQHSRLLAAFNKSHCLNINYVEQNKKVMYESPLFCM